MKPCTTDYTTQVDCHIKPHGKSNSQMRRLNRFTHRYKKYINKSCKVVLSLGVVLIVSLPFLMHEYHTHRDFNDGMTHAYFLDIGQGDSTLIKTRHHHLILIDTGPDRSVVYEISKVLPLKINTIDFVILSHLHEDHIGGLIHLGNYYKIDTLYFRYEPEFDNSVIFQILHKMKNKPNQIVLYSKNQKYFLKNLYTSDNSENSKRTDVGANKLGASKIYDLYEIDSTSELKNIQGLIVDYLQVDATTSIKNVYVDVCATTNDSVEAKGIMTFTSRSFCKLESDNPNNRSLISMLYDSQFHTITINRTEYIQKTEVTDESITIIFTGDLEKEMQSFISDFVDDSLIIKAPHQGAKDALNTRFLSKVKPRYAVIFAGVNNRYGHPHKEVVEAYKNFNIKLFRTDELGTIAVTY